MSTHRVRAIDPPKSVSGELGILDLYLSVPCIIGAHGVERILLPHLPAKDLAALLASAVALRSAMEQLTNDAVQ